MKPRLLPSLPRQAWIVLVGDLLSAVGSGLTLPFLIVYLHRVRGMELELAGLAVATIGIAALVGNPTAGVLVDRIGARRTLLLGLIVAAAGTASIAFVETAWEAFGATATHGFGMSLIWPALDSLLAVAVGREQRSSVFSVRHATMNTGFGIGALIAAGVVSFESTTSFQLLYLLDSASFLLFAPLVLALRGIGDRPEPDEERNPAGYRVVLRDRVFLRIVLLTALICGAGYAQMGAAFPAFATGEGGISAGALGLVFAVNTVAVSVLQLPALRISQGRRRTALLAIVFVLFASAWAVTLAAGALEGGARVVAVFALAELIFAVGETLASPTLTPMVNDLAPDRLRGRYNAVSTLAWTSGFIVGPLVAGTALGSGHSTAFFLGLIAACLLGAAASYRLRPLLPGEVDLVRGWDAAPKAHAEEVAHGARLVSVHSNSREEQ